MDSSPHSPDCRKIDLVAVDGAVAVRGPAAFGLARSAQAAVLAAVLGAGAHSRHDVVGVESEPDPAAALLLAERRHQERGRIDEVRGEFDHELALEQGFPDQADVEVLEVAQPAVDHLRRTRGGADRKVTAFEQRHRISPRGGIERDSGTGDATTDDDHLEFLAGDGLDRLLAGQHRLTRRISSPARACLRRGCRSRRAGSRGPLRVKAWIPPRRRPAPHHSERRG